MTIPLNILKLNEKDSWQYCYTYMSVITNNHNYYQSKKLWQSTWDYNDILISTKNKHIYPGNTHNMIGSIRLALSILSHLNKKFATVSIEQRFEIDEQMCATKAADFMKQHLPNKPHKWGFTLYIICRVHKFEIYTV